MALAKIKGLEGRGVYVAGDDIDTDRIIPARFMKCVTFDGLGQYAFYDVRFDEKGKPKSHPLNDERFKGASILFSGKNFGCGSSREHAPQSLHKFGIRAVVAESFAEIFFGNCTTLGIPCVTLTRAQIEEIGKIIEKDPKANIAINLEKKELQVGGKSYSFEMKEVARSALTAGQWDPIGDLLEGAEKVNALAAKLPYTAW
ncbi:MAG: 3-isopropylmalate dehydratase small subunit [Bdellovibrionota bacterium]